MGRSHAAASRRTVAPRNPRRISGPIRPGVPRPVTAVPPRVRVTSSGAVAAERPTGAAARLRALPDHRFLDTLLRSRAWIWVLGIALGGIVAMQVSLLKMNAGIGTAVQQSADLQHANASLQEQVAELSSGERIADAAGQLGLIVPDAGSVGYLTVRPGVDARRAAMNMVAPSDAARQLLASGGQPSATPTTGTTTTATAPTTTTASTPTTSTPVAATATPVPTAAPVATATPAPVTTTPTTTTTTPTTAGAATAPGQ